MDFEDASLNSARTMAGNDLSAEPTLNSARTMVGGAEGLPSLGLVDQYSLVRKLGGGGFGVVYLARDTVSRVDVALKTLHPLLKNSPEEMENLRAKFALVRGLRHPNIAAPLVLHPVRQVAIDEDAIRRELRLSPGDSVMVMDYAPGVTLSKWRKQFPGGVVPLSHVLEIGRQLASALDYAHSEKIIHRDIKPANIVVETREDASLRARILDFGLAAEIRSSMSQVSNETGDTSGTRPYMSPEQWLGRRQNGRTDQYAFACVLYELLAGEPPFAGVFETGDPIIMRTAVEHDAPEEIDDVPSPINAALLRALAKNPKDRFASCAELVAAMGAQKGSAAGIGKDVPEPPANPAGRQTRGEQQAVSEAEVLRRKVVLARELKKISDEDRADKEFSIFYLQAETEFEAAEEAIKLDKFAAAGECLNRAIGELDKLVQAKKDRVAREEAERKAREEAERKAREEAERKARAEAERKAREEEERKAREEEERKAREEEERKEREEAERRAQIVRKVARYCVIDISGGASASSYPVTYLVEPPAGGFNVDEYKTVKLVLRRLEPGSFQMGSPVSEDGSVYDEKQHEVKLTKRFFIGIFEVTQKQWELVMGNNPSEYKGSIRPVEKVSYDTIRGCSRGTHWPLSSAVDPSSLIGKLRVRTGLDFDLPTEAQWEYACRAGTISAYNNGGHTENDLKLLGRYAGNWTDGFGGYSKHTAVGSYAPNAWGLYDMHGNVWEWCLDWYGALSGSQTDPIGSPSGAYRVLRGGSWSYDASYCRSAYRNDYSPSYEGGNIGLRLALSSEL